MEPEIHHPTDSTLLVDGVRLVTRLLTEGKELSPTPRYLFRDRRRVVKKRVLTILNAKKGAEHQSACKDVFLYAGKVREYALALPEFHNHQDQTVNDLFAARC